MGESVKKIDYLAREFAHVPAVELVRAVNDSYYNRSAARYDDTPDIAVDAAAAWQKVTATIKSQMPAEEPFTVIDIGSGTGFVAEMLLKSGVPFSRYLGYEPSPYMRDLARKKIVNRRVSFHSLDTDAPIAGVIAPVLGRRIVTLNSVLHHIVWWEEFLTGVIEALGTGDILVLCHEPNNRFWENSELVALFDNIVQERRKQRPLSAYLQPGSYLRKFRQLCGRNQRGNENQAIAINDELIGNGTLKRKLQPEMIGAIIDYSVPLCWRNISYGREYDEGFFSIPRLEQDYLQGFERVLGFTYQHLGIAKSLLSLRWQQVNDSMTNRYPDDGAQFCLIVRKSAGA